MGLLTTCIGAYPKPDYVAVPDWFKNPQGPDTENPTANWQSAVEALGEQAEEIFARGTHEAIEDQVQCGIDIPTDGEIRRENYIHYHCRHLRGIDFENLTEKELRNGAYTAALPTIVGPIEAGAHFLTHDWNVAQSFTEAPVKITMPGPMTMSDTLTDAHYGDPAKLGEAFAAALNSEVLALAEAGCTNIQIDEPLFARKPDAALAYGMENLERAFHGCPGHVTRTVHMCCGYPDRLDNADYPKAPPDAYFKLAQAVDDSSIMAISVEDAHRPNDLSLLEKFQATHIIFGVVAIARSRIESIDEIRQRLENALDHIDSHRLIAAPDCGLGLLGRERAMVKLKNLSSAAHSVGA
ncbi:MAG: 5-methyltetrahydropteroyltriglutamate--homocysteine methyltransferase [Gammaproteobacteria bacterium]|nr:5-methyltetrahydropteroyltriglutamate--homocysteine methyltransferase [Gammaproteobacteria bacterium]